MADVRRDTRLHSAPRLLTPTSGLVAASSSTASARDELPALTAASQVITEINRYRPLWHESWQDEAWSYYESLGEFNYGVEWFAEALSRVRLTAAKVTPGGDEPEPLTSGPAAKLVQSFMGGVDGQAQLLRSLAVQLSVAGDTYFVGREVTDTDLRYGLLMDAEPDESGNVWTVNPVNTLRRHRGRFLNFARRQERRYEWELRVDDNAWVPLGPESLVVRIWDRNEHEPWRAMSPAKAALPIMREIDMYNRHIIASLVSRVAMNGMLFIPDEVVLPASPQYENASDPFVAEMLDVMMAAIKNPGSPAAAAPMPVRIPAEYIEKFKHLTFASGLDGKVFESRAEAIRRLAATLNLPAEVITGMGDVNHWCKTRETRAYTPNGWSSDVRVGDTILTLDHDTGLARWSPVIDIYRAPVVVERMLTVHLSNGHGGQMFELTSTPDHRYPIIRDGKRIVVRGHELRRGDVITRGAPVRAPETPTFTDDLVRLVAWYSADGTLTGTDDRPNQIRIGKSWRENPGPTANLVSALTGVFGPARESMPTGIGPAWRMEHQDRGMMIAVLNAAARDVLLSLVPGKSKIIPREFVDKLTSAQLDIFLTTWMISDGSGGRAHDSAAGSLRQRESARIDAVEHAAIMSGRSVRRWTSESNGFKSGTMHCLTVSSISTAVVRDVVETTYSGEVWCPTTETGTWLAQEPGGWTEYTGNSAWSLSEDAIKIHISPKVEIITRALTLGYLHPMLQALGENVRASDGSRIIVWYDTSELTQRPDRSGAAIQLRELMIISDAATRRETGFDESDKPTDDELERMILMKLALNPQLAPAALKELTGLVLDGGSEAPSGTAAPGNPDAVDDSTLPTDVNVGAEQRAMPDTQGEPPPAPDEGVGTITADARTRTDVLAMRVVRARQLARADASTNGRIT